MANAIAPCLLILGFATGCAASERFVVMRRGNDPVPLVENEAASRAWIEPGRVPARGVLVRQQLRAQTATLLGARQGTRGVSVKGGGVGSRRPSGPDTVTTDADGNPTTTPGCSAGSSGSSGAEGVSGSAGPDGKRGRVTLVVDG